MATVPVSGYRYNYSPTVTFDQVEYRTPVFQKQHSFTVLRQNYFSGARTVDRGELVKLLGYVPSTTYYQRISRRFTKLPVSNDRRTYIGATKNSETWRGAIYVYGPLFQPRLPQVDTGLNIGDSTFTSLYNKAAAKLARRIGDTTINLPVAFGEFGETTRMYANTVRRLGVSLMHVKRGNIIAAATNLLYANVSSADEVTSFRRGGRGRAYRELRTSGLSADEASKLVYGPNGYEKRKLLDRIRREWPSSRVKQDPAGAWLELRYGWGPHLSDLFGAVKQLAQMVADGKQLTQHVAIDCEDTRTYTRSISNDASVKLFGDLAPAYSFTCTEDEISAKKVRITCRYKISNPYIAQAAQLGLTNPVLAAFELMPLSFVSNWFSNLGDVLGGLSAFHGKYLEDGAVGYDQTVTMRLRNFAVAIASGWTKHGTAILPSVQEGEHHHYQRNALPAGSSFPSPSFQLELGLTFKRAVDAAALLHQRLR